MSPKLCLDDVSVISHPHRWKIRSGIGLRFDKRFGADWLKHYWNVTG